MNTASMTKTRADEIAVANGCYFDAASAERPHEFFRRFLKIRVKGGTTPFKLSAWQDEVTTALFGWRRKDKKRRFREAYISMGKKGGKTFWAAALLIYMLVCEIGPGQECYSFATEREQSALVYREAAKMIRASPELKQLVETIRTNKTLMFTDHGSFFRSMSAEADSADGINSAFTYYDEIHRAKSRELLDTLKYAGTAIEARTGEPSLLVCTTTAGYNRDSICYEQYSYAKRVQTGEIADDAFYTFVAEADVSDDISLETTWRKANPALGSEIMSIADFRRDYDEAKANPAAANRFRRLRLNQWTEQATRWLPLELWDANGGTIDLPSLVGRECVGGLDLSSVGDTTAFVLTFKNDLGGYDILPRIYVPEENLEAQGRRNGVSYSAWAKAGLLHLTPGNAIDYATIREDIVALGQKYKIKEIGFDSWNSAKIIPELELDGFICVPIRQGYSLSQPAKELYRLLMGHKIRHGNHPVARWQAGNVEAQYDRHENIRLEKPGGSSSKLRIDSIVATVMSIDRNMRHTEIVDEGFAIGVF